MNADNVFITTLPTEKPNSREAVVRYLAQVAGQGNTATETAICASALEREASESTYIGRGLAVPHARVAGLADAVVCMTACPTGVDWNGETATFIALTAVPENRPELHLQILSALARYFSAHKGETHINTQELAAVLRALFC